jgi:hypothetical protein
MSWSITEQWRDWCAGDTSRATDDDWNAFVRMVYESWVEEESENDENLNDLEGDEYNDYFEENYSEEVFFENSEANEELQLIKEYRFNMSTVSWDETDPPDGEEDILINRSIRFDTESTPNDELDDDGDYEEVQVKELLNFYITNQLNLSPNDASKFTVIYESSEKEDNELEIEEILSYYLANREEE